MDKNYFIDTLFDLINESDALETDLQDIHADCDCLTVIMKDESSFKILVIEGR